MTRTAEEAGDHGAAVSSARFPRRLPATRAADAFTESRARFGSRAVVCTFR